jgi:hypothetical protein
MNLTDSRVLLAAKVDMHQALQEANQYVYQQMKALGQKHRNFVYTTDDRSLLIMATLELGDPTFLDDLKVILDDLKQNWGYAQARPDETFNPRQKSPRQWKLTLDPRKLRDRYRNRTAAKEYFQLKNFVKNPRSQNTQNRLAPYIPSYKLILSAINRTMSEVVQSGYPEPHKFADFWEWDHHSERVSVHLQPWHEQYDEPDEDEDDGYEEFNDPELEEINAYYAERFKDTVLIPKIISSFKQEAPPGFGIHSKDFPLNPQLIQDGSWTHDFKAYLKSSLQRLYRSVTASGPLFI